MNARILRFILLAVFLVGLLGFTYVGLAVSPDNRPIGYILFSIVAAFGLVYFLVLTLQDRADRPSVPDEPTAEESDPSLGGPTTDLESYRRQAAEAAPKHKHRRGSDRKGSDEPGSRQ